MQTASNVRVIPPRAVHITTSMDVAVHKKRVAAYARVSTDFDEQQTSYKAQVDHYTKYIKENPEWHYVNVYSDEGISATSTKKRDGFNRMISDALSGKIDLILTKSVSRFARNTVDTLTTVRQLKEKGVEVFFEKENIYTMDSKGELLITIMGSLAQEESRSLSENVRWGQRKRFADGKVSLPYGQFLGYEKGEDGLPKIVEKEAKVVRLIYKLFLEGITPSKIAKHLTEKNIPTPGGKQNWQASTVRSILQNEKYRGDALLQKSYTVDFLTKKKKINEGEVPQFYVENSHDYIISPEVFEMVQEEFRRRKSAGKYTSAISCFASRIMCGDCGGFYGRKVWHSTSKYANTVWQCNHKFRKKTYCNTPHLKEEVLKLAFISAFNSMIHNKDELLDNLEDIVLNITDLSKQEDEVRKAETDCDVLEAAIEKLIAENARSAMSQKDYSDKYNDLAVKYNELQNKKRELTSQIAMDKAKRSHIKSFIKELKNQEKLLDEFDEDLWCATVDTVTVISDTELLIRFKGGVELPWQIEQ